MRFALLFAVLLAAACGAREGASPAPVAANAPAAVAPVAKRDLRVRWIGLPSGSNAAWITTADDGVPNGRSDGVDLIVDPGTPADVESTLIPALAAAGLKPGARIAQIIVTSGEADRVAGARRLARHVSAKNLSIPEALPGRSGAREPALSYLALGTEVTAIVVRPGDAHGVPAQALLLRFIEMQVLFLPPIPAAAAEPFARAVGETLEKRGLHPTVVSSGTALSAETIAALETEAVVAAAEPGGTVVRLPSPAPGSTLVLETNGAEARAPGPLLRSRYGHWIDCTELSPAPGSAPAPAPGSAPACRAELATSASGPTLVKMSVAGAPVSWFLVDTRSPYSYLARPLFEAIPGWESASTHGHGHAGGALGLAVPAFRLGGLAIRRWHVLPIDAFQVGDQTVVGVIGLDLLQSFRVELSPRADRLALSPNFDEPIRMAGAAKALEGKTGGWDVPMDRSPAGPLILATLDGMPKSLIVDLASAETAVYLNKEELAKRVTARGPVARWSFTVADDIADAGWKSLPLEAGTFRVKDLNLFGAHFSDVPALAVDRPLKADVLGLDFLERFETVQLDFRRKSIALRE